MQSDSCPSSILTAPRLWASGSEPGDRTLWVLSDPCCGRCLHGSMHPRQPLPHHLFMEHLFWVGTLLCTGVGLGPEVFGRMGPGFRLDRLFATLVLNALTPQSGGKKAMTYYTSFCKDILEFIPFTFSLQDSYQAHVCVCMRVRERREKGHQCVLHLNCSAHRYALIQ